MIHQLGTALVVIFFACAVYGLVANAWHETTGRWPRCHERPAPHHAEIRRVIEGTRRERELHQALADWQAAIEREDADARAAAVRRAHIASQRWR